MLVKPVPQCNCGAIGSIAANDMRWNHLNNITRNAKLLRQNLCAYTRRSLIVVNIAAAAVLRPSSGKDASIPTRFELFYRLLHGVPLDPSLDHQDVRIGAVCDG